MNNKFTELLRMSGIGDQVLLAASDMNETAKRAPQWLWHDGHERITYGRWAKSPRQAPYIRADLVLAAMAELQCQITRLESLTP